MADTFSSGAATPEGLLPSPDSRWAGVRARNTLLMAFIYGSLGIATIAVLLPYVYVISGSLRQEMNQFSVPIQWIPPEPQWDNYIKPFTEHNFLRYFLNSGFIALTAMLSNMLFCSLAGYSIAKIRFPGSSLVFMVILSTMMIPSQVTLIPMYLIFKQLGLINTRAGIILPGLAGAFGVFLMRQFCISIPDDYLDAGRIDGASEPHIFARIILPMMRAPLSALAVFSFTGSWNNFLWPLVIVNTKKLYTVPLAVITYLDEQVMEEYGQVQALTVIASVPVFIIFLLFQKEFVRGVAISGLKG